MSLIMFPIAIVVSTHSHPKAAAIRGVVNLVVSDVSTHSHPKAAASKQSNQTGIYQFQHTATRRRLRQSRIRTANARGFNTQPPEGGCELLVICPLAPGVFQHTATRRRLPSRLSEDNCSIKFQHTATRRRLLKIN